MNILKKIRDLFRRKQPEETLKINRLTLLKDGQKALWKCECGTKKWIKRSRVTSGRTKSCGCLQREIEEKQLAEKIAKGRTRRSPKQKLREKMKKIYPFECNICGSKENIEVHHIFSKTSYPKLQWKAESCVFLCNNCHTAFHREVNKTRKDNLCTESDYFEYKSRKEKVNSNKGERSWGTLRSFFGLNSESGSGLTQNPTSTSSKMESPTKNGQEPRKRSLQLIS